MKTTGGGRTTFVFRVRKCMEVNASAEPGDVILSVVKDRLLAHASASHMKVRRALSFICWPFFSIRAESTLLTVLICHSHRSHSPPM